MIEQAIAESIVAAPSPEQDLTKIDDRVLAGVEFLDEHVSDWARKIEVDRFNLHSCELCVLGQLYGDYFYGRDMLLGFDNQEQAVRYGFYSNDLDRDWDRLQEDWKTVISFRQKNTPDVSGAR
jgi:hypothetical protein